MASEPLIAIVGPTASGKSSLAMMLAEKYNGEIICADSRTIYRHMDIGTAKPSKNDQKHIKHHLIDIVDPNERFTAADFKERAQKAVRDISARGKIPILVGGSGMYVDAVLYDYEFSNTTGPRSATNPRHLESSQAKDYAKTRPNTLVIGLQPNLENHEDQIRERIQDMLKNGIVKEARMLIERYGWQPESMKTYEPFRDYLESRATEAELVERLVIKDRQLAKKQRTWFKRNKSIQWIDDPIKAVALVTTFLNK